MKRRDFLKTAAIGTGATLVGLPAVAAPETDGLQLAKKLPRWRGFNLMEKFISTWMNKPFVESDFQWIAELGFDFVRLPMDYRCWTDPNDPYKLDEKVLGEIDQAVQFGRKYGVHVDLNLHRAPGYTVAKPPEKLNLWTDEEAQKQFDFQWSQFARRYRDIPSTRLSFNLVNEPAHITSEACSKVMRRVVAAIRREDPKRLIIADGLRWGRDPLFELADLGIAQSTRGYDPGLITQYGMHKKNRPLPTWPMKQGDKVLDRDWLYREKIEPWKKLEAKGVGIHVGEFGVYCKTPHDVALHWMRDHLGLWKEAGWGWAMWGFRSTMGILDSKRADVVYEDFHGHKLDRKMLELLKEF